ncbi:hypothetical protein BGZ58_000934 [Dissophora ornata]|nr:hypothetical protein BGZ58_000934 [Dissophora ornata]
MNHTKCNCGRNHDGAHLETNEDAEEDEPRSIIVPYAQLPYTGTKDCCQRVVEKEGLWSLWRGNSIECTFFVLQTWVDSRLQHRRSFSSLFDLRRWFPITTETFGGSAWILSAAVEGTIVSGLTLLVVYPLATLRARMATDVVRRTRRVRKVAPTSSTGVAEDMSESSLVDGTADTPSLPGSDAESAEWVNHSDDYAKEEKEQKQERSTVAVPSEQKYEDDLSYRYPDVCDAFTEAVGSSEGYLGLYKGFTAALVGSFISRLGFLAIYRMVSPMVLRSGQRTNGLGAFLLIFGATSVINLMAYPLSTVCHRRMIAGPGRYSSSWDAGKQIVEKQGWKALYNGYEVAMVRSTIIAILSRIFF